MDSSVEGLAMSKGGTYCENTDKETNAEVDDHTVLREWTKWRQGYTDEDVPQLWGAHEEFLRALPGNNAKSTRLWPRPIVF